MNKDIGQMNLAPHDTNLHEQPLAGKVAFIATQPPCTAHARQASREIRGESKRGQAIRAELGAVEAQAQPLPPTEYNAKAGTNGIDVRQTPLNELVFKTAQEILAEPRPAWIIRGLIQERTLNLIVSEPKSFKTFFALDMAAHLHVDSSGCQWQGMDIRKFNNVFYLCLEGHPANRIRAWEIHNGRQFPNVQIYNGSFHMVRNYQALFTAVPNDSILFLDTLSASISGLDENAAKDMSNVTADLYKLIHEKNVTIIVIHHMGKDGSKGARGSSVLLGNVDSQIHIKKIGNDKIKVVAKVIREEKDGEEWIFQRVIYEVGIDEDGSPITSCALRHLVGEVSHEKDRKLNMETAPRQNGINSLRKALNANNGNPVSVDAWRTYFYAGSTADSRENKKKEFQRVRKEFVAFGVVEVMCDMYSFVASERGTMMGQTGTNAPYSVGTQAGRDNTL